jgi:protein-disulfide isomerase
MISKYLMFKITILLMLNLAFVLPQASHSKETSDDIIATINGENILLSSISKGYELEIYEAKKSLYELHYTGLRELLISKLIKLDPNSTGLSEEEYISKFIARPSPVTDMDVERFIVMRKIPQEKINTNFKEQVRNFLVSQQIAQQVELWLAVQMDKQNVKVHLSKPLEPRFQVNIENVAFRGGKDAPVTIVEFSDFQCTYCVRVNETLLQLNRIYGDKIKVVYKHFPLSSIHPEAQKAAEAALCAQEQGMDKFWLLHDKMFANQRNLAVGPLKDMAKEIGLREPFNQCLTSGKFANQVNQDIKEGLSLGVNSTPAFFINGRFVKGALPLESFQSIIDEELKGIK